MGSALIVFAIGIALLVIAYQVPSLGPPARTLCLVFGWILAIIGGVLLVLAVLGVPVSLPSR